MRKDDLIEIPRQDFMGYMRRSVISVVVVVEEEENGLRLLSIVNVISG